MFNSKRVFGLALISIATALSGCGGGSGQADFETVCSDGLVLNSDEMCVARAHACETGTVYPPGFLPDETSTQADCVPIEFDGPPTAVTPGANQVIVFLNRQHIDADYTGVNMHRWGDCWVAGNTSWPGEQVQRDGIDPVYGAYYIFDTVPGCTEANYIWNYNGDANKTADLTVGFTATSSPWNAMDFLVPSDDGRLAGSDGARNGGVATTGIPACIQPEPGNTTDCAEPAPPARLVKEASFHWVANNVFAHNATGAADVVLYRDETPDGPFDQVPALADDGVTANPDAGDIIVDDGTATGTGVSVLATLVEDNSVTLPEGYEGWYAYVVSETPDETDTFTTDQVKAYLKDHLMVSYFQSPDLLGTKVQVHTILDELYVGTDEAPGAEAADLGLTYGDSDITLQAWAPTAKDMDVVIYTTAIPRFEERRVQMTLDDATGVWSVSLPSSDDGKFYRLELSVVDQTLGIMRRVQTIDPYSVSTSTDSLHSQFVNLNASVLVPEGWADHVVAGDAITVDDIVVYSGYLRDFTFDDENVTEAFRGKFLGLTEAASEARAHLAALQAAGVTHVNFLPLADSFGVTEASAYQLDLTDTIFDFCRQFSSEIKPRSEDDRPLGDVCDNTNLESTDTIGAAITELLASDDADEVTQAYTLLENVADTDSRNWGYAPILANVPEGSFSTYSDGPTRVLEMRQMVQSLHEMGLRVSMDVIYSYLSASGFESPRSVMDKLVPGYYVRRDPITGLNENEAGTPEEGQTLVFADTASENAMMAEFIKDSLAFWAREYKIDAFRFDGLGSVDADALVAAQAAADAANTLSPVYVYGTSGNDDDQPGTGVGSYNSLMASQLQSLALVKAGYAAVGEADLGPIDKIRAGMAGNLAAFPFFNAFGAEITGNDLSVGAYGLSVQENVAHVTYHDNGMLTLWDTLHSTANGNYGVETTNDNGTPDDTSDDFVEFAPFAASLSAADRARIQVLSFAVPMLSQGVSSFELGTELLRSRSMGSDNSNSGDWFNAVDFGQDSNGWNVATPFTNTNDADRALEDAEVADVSDQIAWTYDMFVEYLEISNSSPLFKLSSADDVIARVGFHNQGLEQTPGVIVMSIDDGTGVTDLDMTADAIVVVVNGTGSPVTQNVSTATGFTLHADHSITGASFSYDAGEDVGSFTVPALTAAVFVKVQSGAQGAGLSRDASPAPAPGATYPQDIYLRGGVEGWAGTVTADQEFVYVGNDTYELVLSIPAGADLVGVQGFKISTRDWGAADRIEISDAGTAFALDTPVTLSATCATDGCGNMSYDFQADTDYVFTLDASNAAEPILTISDTVTVPYGGVDLYMRGNFEGWSDPPLAENQLTYKGYGLYGLLVTAPDEADADTDYGLNFKFAAADWGNAAADIGAAGGSVASLGAPFDMAVGGGNIDIAATEGVMYYMAVDARTEATPTLLATEAPFGGAQVYLRGTHIGWGDADPAYEFEYMGGGVYQLDATFTAAQLGDGAPAGTIRFKIADGGWSGTVDYGIADEGSGFGTATIGDANNLLGSANIQWAPEADLPYRMVFDASGSIATLRITPFRAESVGVTVP